MKTPAQKIDEVRRHSMWTRPELAQLLHMTEDAIKELCKTRTQARKGRLRLPFFLLNGRPMFYRWKIEKWQDDVEAAETAKQDAQIALYRGKKRRAA
jgi:hypothetical protein